MQSSSVSSMRLLIVSVLLLLSWTILGVNGSPVDVELIQREAEADAGAAAHWEYLEKRTYFPDYPPSCQICEQNYANIDSCANASVVFANISEILYSPLSFLDVLNCACTDTFKSTYPQCVDCFEQTNQTVFLEPNNGQNLSSVVTGIRSICALGSSIFGHVGSANSQLPGQTPITVASAGAALRRAGNVFEGMGRLSVVMGMVLGGVGMGVWTVL